MNKKRIKTEHLLLFVICFIVFWGAGSCGKKNTPGTGTPPPSGGDDTVIIEPPVEPSIASTIGFFLDDWQPKTFSTPATVSGTMSAEAVNTLTINPSNIITKIPESVFGDNSNLWMTQIVTEPVLMNYIKQKEPAIIRFPGGSISDIFFWNTTPNNPPADAPGELVNADGTSETAYYWYGKNNDNWTFSVENYYKLRQETGSQGMITINYGYARYGTSSDPVAAAAHLAADWVRYDNGRTRYWEIGNENFGNWEAGYRIKTADNKDGQPEYLSGELYARHFKVFADSMKAAAQEAGAAIQIGAVLYETTAPSWETNTVKTWNSGLLANINDRPDFYVVHSYYTDYKTNASASEILATAGEVTRNIMTFYKQTMQTYGAKIKPLALDEWNITSQGSQQQVSFVNGMHAAILIQEAIKNNFAMTARWDLANAWDNGDDHGLFSQGEPESGESKWSPRPVYYYMYFLKKMLGDRLVEITNTNSGLEAYASSFSSGQVGFSVINKSASATTVKVAIKNFKQGDKIYWYQLTGGSDNGDFSRKVFVNGSGPSGIAGGPADFANIKANVANVYSDIRLSVPARGAIFAVVENKP